MFFKRFRRIAVRKGYAFPAVGPMFLPPLARLSNGFRLRGEREEGAGLQYLSRRGTAIAALRCGKPLNLNLHRLRRIVSENIDHLYKQGIFSRLHIRIAGC